MANILDGSSTNSSAAMSAAISADFGTDTATLQTKLNALMTTLNAVHPSAVFEYAIDNSAKSITLRQRDGGEILLGGFVTASTHKDLTASRSYSFWDKVQINPCHSKIMISRLLLQQSVLKELLLQQPCTIRTMMFIQ